MESIWLQNPLLSAAVAALLSLALGGLICLGIRAVVHGIPAVLNGYPLLLVEQDYPDCRATWIAKGALLTSRGTGKTVAEIPVSTVVAVVSRRDEVLARMCLRFNPRFKNTSA
jgi:hypothetical protein